MEPYQTTKEPKMTDNKTWTQEEHEAALKDQEIFIRLSSVESNLKEHSEKQEVASLANVASLASITRTLAQIESHIESHPEKMDACKADMMISMHEVFTDAKESEALEQRVNSYTDTSITKSVYRLSAVIIVSITLAAGFISWNMPKISSDVVHTGVNHQ